MRTKAGARSSLITSLILAVGLTLLVCIAAWAFFSIRYQKQRLIGENVILTERLSNTIRLGTHYAMMLNSGEDINRIIHNISRQRGIENIRIYNKEGLVRFSSRESDIGRRTTIDSEACRICHRQEPPPTEPPPEARVRMLPVDIKGQRMMGFISPILNEPGCTGSCHVHTPKTSVLGLLDVVVSLNETNSEIAVVQNGVIGLAVLLFLLTSVLISFFILRFVNKPITKLIHETRRIAQGDYSRSIDAEESFEMEQLAEAINDMAKQIESKQDELNKQKDRFRQLFEQVPCAITVQDRNYRLIEYNQEFEDTFAPKQGDFCYYAYKGRTEKCENCPVERTFRDGSTHYSEEAGLTKWGEPAHWIVRTSPIRDEAGEIVAAMEMCLDITHSRILEKQLKEAEKNYYGIFNNIPNPVFVLDKESLVILDCNQSVKTVYGLEPGELLSSSFLDLFLEEDKSGYLAWIHGGRVINQARQRHRDGRTIYVTIRVSPSKYRNREVLLVTTGDITKRLEAEQQLIQASKMATLGEMASGVAHELNQPLAVIKTAGSILMKKLRQSALAADETLLNVSAKIDANVDRAANIIEHMRQFARKYDARLEPTQINRVIENAFEMFDQQFKARGIATDLALDPHLPVIMAEPNRLEQVFVNLFINARDAIEEKGDLQVGPKNDKRVRIVTRVEKAAVMVEICDTGVGIPPPIAQKIFEPFFTTKEVGKGTGLGLSISYGIVSELGGDIFVKPRTGGGACFVMRFPLKAGQNGIHDSAG